MTEGIKGYRTLTDAELHAINAVKEVANAVKLVVDAVALSPHADQRWLAIATTDLQKGFMALTRSIARPEGF